MLIDGMARWSSRTATIGLANDGTEPLGVTFTFSRSGFEETMRDNAVLEGQPVTPLLPEERARILARHRWHTVIGPAPK